MYILFARFGWFFALARPVEEYQVFYIGAEGPTLSNLLLNYSRSQVMCVGERVRLPVV